MLAVAAVSHLVENMVLPYRSDRPLELVRGFRKCPIDQGESLAARVDVVDLQQTFAALWRFEWSSWSDRLGGLVGWLRGLKPEEWSAIGTMGTFVVAVAAALVAFYQVHEARTLRIEQARPYVAAYLELGDDIDVTFIRLVVKNFGLTTARDVTIRVDRPMKRAWGKAAQPEDLLLFDRLPVLVPGQSWRTLFDWGPDRFKANLNDVYTLVVSSRDSRGKPLPDETFVLDWNTFKPTRNVGVRTIHDVGKTLEKLEKSISSWGEGVSGLKVYTRSGEAKDARELDDYLERFPEADPSKITADNLPAPEIRDTRIEQVVDQEQTAAHYRVAGAHELPSEYPRDERESGTKQAE